MPQHTRLFLPWVVLTVWCIVLMWMVPGEETVPFHIAWMGVALAYGLEPWPDRLAAAGITGFTLVSGGVLVVRASEGVIPWEETTEIPMMAGLMLLVMWNVRRRHMALGALNRLAAEERAGAAQRERLSRMTSHEMRTPATIASGYAEVLLLDETDPGRREDLEVIRDELHRLVKASDRLVRMIRLQDQRAVEELDLHVLLSEVAVRWQVVADRDWQVDADPGTLHLCSPERVRACLDTLVENAVRYTETGDTVRLVARAHGDLMVVGVADSGPGIKAVDPRSQTGFGLSLLRDAAESRGGHVATGRSAEGGALVVMVVPRTPSPSREVVPVEAPALSVPVA